MTEDLTVKGNAFVNKSLAVEVNVTAKNKISDSILKRPGVMPVMPGVPLQKLESEASMTLIAIKTAADGTKAVAQSTADALATASDVVAATGETVLQTQTV
ncbi:hypothetical protein D3C84_1020840 [compost metagenome]